MIQVVKMEEEAKLRDFGEGSVDFIIILSE